MNHFALKATTMSIAFALTWLVFSPAWAEDIDLFTTANGNAAPPNVYIMIDNSANWNATIGGTTKKKMEHDALNSVFVSDPSIAGTTDTTDADPIKINLGIGLFADSNSPKGGKVMSAIEPLTSTYQSELGGLFFDANGDPHLPKSNNAPYALSFNEAIAYFAGEAPIAGTQDGDHDPDAIAADGTYKMPIQDNTCGKNYVILIGNGEPDSGEDNNAEAKLDARGGVLGGDPISINPSNFESNWSDEYARYMAGADIVPQSVRGDFERNVRTYVIDVFDPNQPHNRKFDAARSWMKSIQKWGDGRYFTASSTSEVKDALEAILDELFAVDSVFAASTLPVSVNVRGTNLNQVYMGVFRPSETDQTRWPGNLKLYQLEVDSATGELLLADANGDPAQSPTTGFIVNDAESFWTHASTYWSFDPRGTPKSGSDLPDGPVVEKGGAHQQLRDQYNTDPTTRPLFTYTSGTCVSSGGCSMDDFSTSNLAVNQASLGTSSTTETQTLVDWVHGENNATDSTDPDTKTSHTVRPSVHGDVLHSRPAVINYGDTDGDGNSEVYTFYGANDGIFHAIRGGKNATSGGEELWGFIPEEFFGKLKPLRDRATGKEYFADGGVATYKLDQNGDGVIDASAGDKVRLYIGMRRGGRLIYALDVSDPQNPKYLWKLTSSSLPGMGQTWSQPKVANVDDDGSGSAGPVIVFGGGYDPGSEDPGASGSASMGNGLYVVDADDGSLIWHAGPSSSISGVASYTETVSDMTYSIPSDVTVIDSDGDGHEDRVYVGDTGGQVWRADLSGGPSSWEVNKIASVGEAAGGAERKFLYPPDVVRSDNGYYAVLIGSGDRVDPFKTSISNRFYMFKDTNLAPLSMGAGWTAITESDLYDVTDNLIQVGTETQQQDAQNALDAARGWKLRLTNSGEKVVSSAVTLGGAVFFNTNEPPASDAPCGQSLGTARFYEVNFENGAAILENNNQEGLQTSDRSSKAAGGGFPPSPVPVIVEIDGKKYQTVITGTETQEPPGSQLERRNPVYWDMGIDN